MSNVTVRVCSVAEVEACPSFAALCNEYAAEAGRAIEADASPQIDFYKQAEAAGTMRFCGAWLDGELVGFLSILLSVVPHFGLKLATTETLFVSASARSSGAGALMLDKAEDIARESGAVGLVVSAPVGGRLSFVLPRRGFKHTNQLFFKGLQ